MDRARHTVGMLRVSAVALAVVCAFVVSMGLEALHLAFTPHAICAAHGELIHAHDHAFEDAEEAPAGLSGLPEDDTHHDHEHCTTALCTDSSAPMPWVSTGVSVDAPLGPVAVSQTADIAHSALILYLAPKTSPPTAQALS